MRCVQDAKFGYIVNLWSDGKRVYRSEAGSGRTLQAMVAAAEKDAEVAERVKFYQLRAPEEFYDLQADPDALHNLIDLKIERLGIGTGILRKFVNAGGGAGTGFLNKDEYTPPPFAPMLGR